MKLSILSNKNGFTLLEVLISMLVFAIGMLGLAALQGVALKENNDAYLRSLAVFYAYEMGDRIRANPAFWRTLVTDPGDAGLLAGSEAAAKAMNDGVHPFCSTDDPPGGPAGPNPGVFCDPTQLAEYDLYRWWKDIQDTLPNGDVATSLQAGPGGGSVIRLVISWNMTNTTVTNINPTFTFDVRP